MAKRVVYVSFMLHGNMSYDRYTKQTIEESFPKLYRKGVDALLADPSVPAVVDLSGITIRWLDRVAPDVLEGLRLLAKRDQIDIAGCQYACSVNANTDEITTFEACRLGMDLAREHLDPRAEGFFCQEMSYHQQIPWVLRQLGCRWTVLKGRPGERMPVLLDGLSGDRVYGFIQAQHSAEGVASELAEVEDGAYYLLGCDFEMLPDMGAVRDRLSAAEAATDVEIRFATVRSWLAEREGTLPPRRLPARGNAIARPLELESFSRWTLKPRDIEFRGELMRAMAAVRSAELLAALLPSRAGTDTLPDAALAVDNPWDALFEHHGEFADDASRLRARGRDLARARHMLLIGANSDAVGWAPWQPRQLHRQGELRRATVLSEAHAAALLRSCAATQGTADPVVYAVFNPTRARETTITIDQPIAMQAEGAPVMHTSVNGAVRHHIRVALPDYGCANLALRPSEAAAWPGEWEPGSQIEAGGMSIARRGEGVALRLGSRTCTVGLAPFLLTDVANQWEPREVAPDLSRGIWRWRRTPLGPQLECMIELEWPLMMRWLLEPQGEVAMLTIDLWAHQPCRIGELGSYDPEGLRLDVVTSPGALAHSIPFGAERVAEPGLSHVVAHRFAALEQEEGGVAVLPVSGLQGISADPSSGRLGLRLGASALGELDQQPSLTIRDGYGSHGMHTTGAVFSGHYRHRIGILLFGPSTTAAALHHLGRQLQEPPLVVRVPGPVPAGALLEMRPEALDVAGVVAPEGRPELVVFNPSEEPANGRLRTDGATWQSRLEPYGIARVSLSAR